MTAVPRQGVAALFIDPRGPYPDLVGTEHCWDKDRNARLYPGPWPVVAHPPCKRWCRLAKFVERRSDGRLAVGADDGCFSFALEAVRKWGGVLEHPAWSLAWGAHSLIAPPARGWQRDMDGGWACEIAQSAYGHECHKLTWLYYVGSTPPSECRWERPEGTMVVSHCSRRGDGSYWQDNRPRLSKRKASLTPVAFAEFLVELAGSSRKGINPS